MTAPDLASEPLLMTSREFAAFAKIRFETLQMMWSQGRGPEKTRRGKHVYIAQDEAERWLRAQEDRA